MKVFSFLPNSLDFQNKLGMLTRSVGVDFQPCKTEEEAKIFAANEKNEDFFLFVDGEKTDFLKDFSHAFPKSKIVVILDETTQNNISPHISCENIFCYVATHNGKFDAHELIPILKKIQSKDHSGLEKHLGFPAVIHEKKIQNPSDKTAALSEVGEFILKIDGNSESSKQYASRVCELADELVLNAICEANPRLKHTSRETPFLLLESEAILLKWGFDGEMFGISVTDPFGSLTRKTVMQYLDINPKTKPLNKRSYGNLGIKLIFDRLHHFIVNVTPTEKTEIICLMRFDKNLKDFDKRLRTFHYC